MLLSAAQADARSYAAQARALVHLHDLAGQEETQLSKVPQFPVLELAGTLRISQQSVTVRATEADRLHTALPLTLAALTRADLLAELPGLVLHGLVLHGLVLHGHSTCPTTNTNTGSGSRSNANGNPSGDCSGANGGGGCRAPQPTGLSPIGILLNILVPMDTALDRGVQPATLTGYGPISAAHVRLLRPTAHLRPLYIDSRSGQPLALGDTIYPPPAADQVKPTPRAERATPAPPVTFEPPAPPPHPAPQADHADQAGHRGDRPERQQPQNAEDPGQHQARPAHWDPESFRSVVQQFAQPIEVTDTAEPQHDPSRRLTRLLQLRDVRCAGPGSSVPAARCDRDHLTPYRTPGGVTAAWNLRHLSRRCHRAKHHGWILTSYPSGNATWLSPLGRTFARPSPHDPPTPSQPTTVLSRKRYQPGPAGTTDEPDWDWGHNSGPLANSQPCDVSETGPDQEPPPF